MGIPWDMKIQFFLNKHLNKYWEIYTFFRQPTLIVKGSGTTVTLSWFEQLSWIAIIPRVEDHIITY